jgi:hypothetical protein
VCNEGFIEEDIEIFFKSNDLLKKFQKYIFFPSGKSRLQLTPSTIKHSRF